MSFSPPVVGRGCLLKKLFYKGGSNNTSGLERSKLALLTVEINTNFRTYPQGTRLWEANKQMTYALTIRGEEGVEGEATFFILYNIFRG